MTVRIGAGAGFAGDRIGPAKDLAERGNLKYLAFECLAERTLAYGHLQRMADPLKGYHPLIERRLGAVLKACADNGTTIVTNMGVANPRAAGHIAAELAKKLGLKIKIAVVEGDDLTSLINPETRLDEIGKSVKEHGLRVVGANAYLGIDAILPALDTEPNIIITGRVADPSLFLAPLVHHFGWQVDDWQILGAGTAVGHLLECTTQVTGGYFADPPYKVVPDLSRIGFPYAEVDSNGSAVITKLDGTGGLVSELTVKEQLLYEVHDPSKYFTPDVTADFSSTRIKQIGKDRVLVSGATGTQRPKQLKTIVGFDGGFLAEAEFSYAGPGAQTRAELARQIIDERMREEYHCSEKLRYDLIGVNSLHATAKTRPAQTEDVRLRVAMRTSDRLLAETLCSEVESLWIGGPAGGGGYRGHVTPSVTTQSIYVDRDAIKTSIEVMQS